MALNLQPNPTRTYTENKFPEKSKKLSIKEKSVEKFSNVFGNFRFFSEIFYFHDYTVKIFFSTSNLLQQVLKHGYSLMLCKFPHIVLRGGGDAKKNLDSQNQHIFFI